MDYGYMERPSSGGRTRRLYAEVLTDAHRAALAPDDAAYCERLVQQGHTVAVLYESNGEGGTIASLGTVSDLTEMTLVEFVAARDARWPDAPDAPDVSVSNATALGGELGIKHIRGQR